MIYYQGHGSPGMLYARSFLEGRLTEEQLTNFRREVGARALIYPHPYLMPDYWQSQPCRWVGTNRVNLSRMFINIWKSRQIPKKERKIWAFLNWWWNRRARRPGAISLAGRENLENLIWVINCNFIAPGWSGTVTVNHPELESVFSPVQAGGWLKLFGAVKWDTLLDKDQPGALKHRMLETLDGEYQVYKARDGKFVRDYFFGKYQNLPEMVKDWTDQEIQNLDRGGHDPMKCMPHLVKLWKPKGQPTVILVKTVKGYGLSNQSQTVNKTHQIKNSEIDSLKYFRDRFDLPFTDTQFEELPFYRPDENSAEIQYLKGRRQALGGHFAQSP